MPEKEVKAIGNFLSLDFYFMDEEKIYKRELSVVINNRPKKIMIACRKVESILEVWTIQDDEKEIAK